MVFLSYISDEGYIWILFLIKLRWAQWRGHSVFNTGNRGRQCRALFKGKKKEENPAGFHKTWPPITIDMFPFNLQRRGGRKQDVTTRRGNSLPAELEWEWAEWAFQSVGGTEHIQTQHEALSSWRKTGNNPERHRRLRGGETSRTSAERLYWLQNTAHKYTHQQNQYEHMV